MPYDLAVGMRFELELSWLTPALRDLERHRPERTLHLVFGDSPDLLSRVRNGLLDCVITSTRLATGGLSYETLHDEDYVFVASAALLARRPLRVAEHAAGHVLLDAAPDLPLFRYFLDATRHRDVWSFSKVEQLGTIGAIRLRLLQCASVAVLPRYFVARDLGARRLLRILPGVRLQRDAFCLVWRTGHPRQRELRDLATDLRRFPLQ